MEESPNRIDSVARLLVAAYVGALVSAPAPIALWFQWYPLWVLLFAPCAFAGLVAGRRYGALAGMLGFVFSMVPYVFLSYCFSYEPGEAPKLTEAPILVGVFGIPAVCGWLGGIVSSKTRAGSALAQWRHWRAAAAVVCLLAFCTLVIGPRVAMQSWRRSFANEWQGEAPGFTASTTGPWVIIVGGTANEGDYPDTFYYYDPTGLLLLHKSIPTGGR